MARDRPRVSPRIMAFLAPPSIRPAYDLQLGKTRQRSPVPVVAVQCQQPWQRGAGQPTPSLAQGTVDVEPILVRARNGSALVRRPLAGALVELISPGEDLGDGQGTAAHRS